jgi:cell wall-associated NlpC family hydrolase
MITQVLFGELYRINEKENDWVKIQLLLDDYQGWINILQMSVINEQEFLRLSDAETSISSDLVQLLTCENTQSMIPLVIGSSLPAYDDFRISINKSVYLFDGQVSASTLNGETHGHELILNIRQQIIEDAKLLLNAPYLWGGRSPFGIDCSGFVQIIFKLQGLKLLRDASQQATQGEIISLLAEAMPGDLAFFDDADGNITHVGMLIDAQRIIHCSGHVRIDALDHEGIYNLNLQKYTHKLRLIKRII